MNKGKWTNRITGLLLLLLALTVTACETESGENWSANVDQEEYNEDDLETLISTNEKLVDRLEEKMDENRTLRAEFEELEAENTELKEDLLTYRQQTLETEQYVNRLLETRIEIDDTVRAFFMAMHERNLAELDQMTSDRITVDGERELLVVTGQGAEETDRSFHFLQVDTFISMRQINMDYDRNDDYFHVVYGLYNLEEEAFNRTAAVQIEFILDDGNWIVDTITYQ
ncbi:hypothetical protein [Salisediminibacterium selenitireducens]|uniref:Uncharacterized protein n=1 Tax=Bacillus selenitireducens (strain ATCC 700615 / DSM 15326 / MLS10) TaxID=439292 RepID=D6XT66_BACIE|nr:hypothetical protein [Salisediminibacterium selenitireducens]ADH99002.1 hypothetical protein Bsel_1490 [[Bacillus] selenitireducens MLS10]